MGADRRGRWQTAFAGYHELVTADRIKPLPPATGTAFAGYLNRMHARIHPVFADGFLESLAARPADDPLNDPNLETRLEIVLDRAGKLVSIGVVKASFVQAFDLSALRAVERAGPFGAPPAEILSVDDRVYMQWIFDRDERCACSTLNARPSVLFRPHARDGD